jgi:hypothetical protein
MAIQMKGSDRATDPSQNFHHTNNGEKVIHPAEVGNPSEAERHLKILDPTVTNFDFRTFDDNAERDDPKLTRVFYGPLAQYADELKYLNDRGAGVFVTVNETDGKGRKAENIIRARAQFADLDGAPLEPVLQNTVKPHIIVETSPKRFHPYWLVKDMPLGDFTSVQKAIIKRFNSDPAIHDLPRVMRLSAFYHRKREPFLVRIISTTDAPPYPASYFERAKEEPHIPGDKEPATIRDIMLAEGALEIIPPMMAWHDRNYIGMATWRATDGHEEGFEAWCQWLERSGRFNKRAAENQWYRYFRSKPVKLGLGTLIFLANQVDPNWQAKLEEKLVNYWRMS